MPAYKYSKEHKKRPQESKIEYSISMGSHVNPSSLISGEIPFSFPPVNASGGAFEVDVLFLKNLQNFSSVCFYIIYYFYLIFFLLFI